MWVCRCIGWYRRCDRRKTTSIHTITFRGHIPGPGTKVTVRFSAAKTKQIPGADSSIRTCITNPFYVCLRFFLGKGRTPVNFPLPTTRRSLVVKTDLFIKLLSTNGGRPVNNVLWTYPRLGSRGFWWIFSVHSVCPGRGVESAEYVRNGKTFIKTIASQCHHTWWMVLRAHESEPRVTTNTQYIVCARYRPRDRRARRVLFWTIRPRPLTTIPARFGALVLIRAQKLSHTI